jgi:twitching motility protein PilT
MWKRPSCRRFPPHARKAYRQGGIADGSFRIGGVGRFRINLHRERGRAAAALRALPVRVPRLASLGLPSTVELLTHLPRGLVLIGGPTGSGKTTTLAALVDEINRRDARHIVTIEDPIEYEHRITPASSSRSRSASTRPTFPTALRAVAAPGARRHRRRRDARSRDDAHRARGGRDRASRALDRPHDRRGVDGRAHRRLVPDERQNTIRQELSMALAAVMTQTLLPKVGGGLVPPRSC